MSREFRKYQPGQPLRIPAVQANAWTEAAAAHARRKFDRGGEASGLPPAGGLILVKNDSGDDVGRGGVLGLADAIILPDDNLAEFHGQHAFVGELPATANHTGKFAVLLEPLADGRIGRAIASGVVAVKLNVESGEESFGMADVAEGESGFLQIAESGGAQVLWKEEGTGEVWAKVRISNRPCPAQNEKQRVTINGGPTGGTLPLGVTVNDVTETVTLDYNDDAAAAQTAFEGHSEIGSGNVLVTGGPLPNSPIDVEFIADLANTAIPLFTFSTGSLTGGSGVGVTIQRLQIGRA